MTGHNNEILALTVKDVLRASDRYVIPVYQRNYSWGAKEIGQLIDDIIDSSIHKPRLNYYIGTLVVSWDDKAGDGHFFTIDGQQRLTTLTILSAVIKNNFPDVDMSWYNQVNLSFQIRKKSTVALYSAFKGNFDQGDYELNIKAGYEICEKELDKKLRDNKTSIEQFANYLYAFVTILRVPLPADTDLNHYFEIMNSRGEQLEKHEILKAQLMKCFRHLKGRKKFENCFNLIWEACSDMERYVQYGFDPAQRHLVFGKNDWNTLDVRSFDEVVNKLATKSDVTDPTPLSIEEILNLPLATIKEKESADVPDRFNTVIDFPNFLLHVLRVQTGKEKVALDDKRLLALFGEEMPEDADEQIEFVKEFIFNLLKGKFLLDKYVIKREFQGNSDKWSLKALKWYKSGPSDNATYVNSFGGEEGSLEGDNRRVLMLLSMLHVSIPSMSYKYWLNAAITYFFVQQQITAKRYIGYLEHIAKSFVFDRFIAKDPAEYFSMINLNRAAVHRDKDDLDLKKLRYKNIENNLVFNFCDYLLWVKYRSIEKDARVANFEFTFRTSVEHFYPQTPFNSGISELAGKYLHSFGNLCLISHEKNSLLYNYPPVAKKAHYPQGTPFDSLKQYLMMKKAEVWNAEEIERHEREMIQLFYDNL